MFKRYATILRDAITDRALEVETELLTRDQRYQELNAKICGGSGLGVKGVVRVSYFLLVFSFNIRLSTIVLMISLSSSLKLSIS